ncbi:MAG: asparagine synthase (glutamine-hydrolyzing) [Terrimicrobiaceae bacterium]|nr:asparagine synthase (glutamine-hydrolyzing) [Terrimicrobiaceae bacterium]
MCAIAGVWAFSGGHAVRETVERMNELQHRRGPDGRGIRVFESQGLALGHCRLSILDPTECGAQPMVSECGRYWITFNGEIFNFLEVREELKAAGCVFRTDTDTEVILAAFRQWGEACAKRFNGMWAFAIWDQSEERLFLCRDRFGVKPLHYVHRPGEFFAFASQANVFGLLERCGGLDEEMLAVCLRDPFLLEGIGRTIFREVRQLSAGTMAWVTRKDFREWRWWSTRDEVAAEHVPEYSEAVDRLRELLEDSCRLRLRSDVPIATALSGGLDSSSVYSTLMHLFRGGATVERAHGNSRTAFSCSLPGTPLDESEAAKQVAAFAGGTVRLVPAEFPHLPEWVEETTRALDFVYVTPAIMAQTYGAMKASGFTVSLDGHGVDEMAFGYGHLVGLALRDAKQANDSTRAADLKETVDAMTPAWVRAMRTRDLQEQESPPSEFRRFANYIRSGLRYRSNQIFGWPPLDDPKDPWLRAYGGGMPPSAEELPTGLTNSDAVLFREFHYRTLPTLLRNYDRASMLNGIEIRMPFMDFRIVRFLFALPQTYKLGGGFTKRILRDAMSGRIPEAVLRNRVKTGWNAPMVDWFSGPLRSMILDHVHSRSFLQSTIWNGRTVRDAVLLNDRTGGWTWSKCCRFWPFLNAHLLGTAPRPASVG